MKKTLLFFFSIGILLTACAPKPVATFTRSAQKLVAPVEITFTNTSVNADSYEWDFGDGTTSTEANPKHRYKNSGNYNVVLRAKKGSKVTTRKELVQVTPPEKCLVEIETEQGTMLAELYNATPKHRDNFTKLAEEGYFNDLLFHRVINGFMIQGGDPNSRGAKAGAPLGMGGPSYQIPAEFVDSLIHTKGAICAARTNNPKKESSGSQFYIVQGSPVTKDMLNQFEAMKGFRYSSEQRMAYDKMGGTPQLDRDYTVFGRVIDGLEIIDKIAAVQTAAGDRPVKDVAMKIRVVH